MSKIITKETLDIINAKNDAVEEATRRIKQRVANAAGVVSSVMYKQNRRGRNNEMLHIEDLYWAYVSNDKISVEFTDRGFTVYADVSRLTQGTGKAAVQKQAINDFYIFSSDREIATRVRGIVAFAKKKNISETRDQELAELRELEEEQRRIALAIQTKQHAIERTGLSLKRAKEYCDRRMHKTELMINRRYKMKQAARSK